MSVPADLSTASGTPSDLRKQMTPELRGWRKVRSHLGAALFNMTVNGIPFHAIRNSYLRACGMHIGKHTCLMRGTLVTRPEQISIGDHCILGFRCFLGGEGKIQIGNNVNISSFCVLLGGYHDIDDPAFRPVLNPIIIEDYAWLATRVTVAAGLRIGRGAVVAAGAVVTRDVPPYHVVAGVPARKIRERNPEACVYEFNYQPWFF